MRRVSLEKKNFVLEFPYSLGILQYVRELPGRRFMPERKAWLVPVSSEAAKGIYALAEMHGFRLEEDALDTVADLLAKADVLGERSANVTTDFSLTVTLGQELFPYQVAGVGYALLSKRCFIGDEMGLGKSAQALAAFEQGGLYPAVIVCPASLKTNWKNEVKKWLPNRHAVMIANSKEDVPALIKYADIIIVNYELLIAKRKQDDKGKPLFPVGEAIRDLRPKAVALDESHYAKNPDALRTQACIALGKGIEYLFCLSGTPVTNKPIEFVGQLKFLGRLDQEFGGYWNFVKRYCGAKQTAYGWDFSGASHTHELNQRLRESCYIRRLKSDVLKELPDKTAQTVYFSFDLKGYKAATKGAVDALYAGASHLEADLHIAAMKKEAAIAKLPAVIEWVQEFLDSGRKLVVFAWHREVIRQLREAFKGISVSIAGDTSTRIDTETGLNDRQRAVDAFQNDESIRLFIGNIRAAGVGITLTAASDVAFVEFVHTPAEHEQAEDRCHRIGQKNAVTAYYLVGEGTIDEEIIESLGVKQEVVAEVSDGVHASMKNRTVMKNILARLREKEEAKAEV